MTESSVIMKRRAIFFVIVDSHCKLMCTENGCLFHSMQC